jgi:hypothetical protein
MQWRESQLDPLPDPLPLDEVRDGITDAILEYVENAEPGILLVRVPPGTGKTTAAVNVCQELSHNGRILYAAPRHDFYLDVSLCRGYERPKWYEWLPIQPGDEEKGKPETCRYAEYLLAWIRRGYPSMDFCKQFCSRDKWMGRCPYRTQAKHKEPIIFGMHQHLVCGMAIDDYALGFCDEMPLGAFLKKRRIPQGRILVEGATGTTRRFLETLHTISGDYASHGATTRCGRR